MSSCSLVLTTCFCLHFFKGSLASIGVLQNGRLQKRLGDKTSVVCSLGVMQITNDSNAAEKMIGKIEGIDTSASSLEVTMELSCKGQLSVLINGGDPFII